MHNYDSTLCLPYSIPCNAMYKTPQEGGFCIGLHTHHALNRSKEFEQSLLTDCLLVIGFMAEFVAEWDVGSKAACIAWMKLIFCLSSEAIWKLLRTSACMYSYNNIVLSIMNARFSMAKIIILHAVKHLFSIIRVLYIAIIPRAYRLENTHVLVYLLDTSTAPVPISTKLNNLYIIVVYIGYSSLHIHSFVHQPSS